MNPHLAKVQQDFPSINGQMIKKFSMMTLKNVFANQM
jgi:hypothetical protein